MFNVKGKIKCPFCYVYTRDSREDKVSCRNCSREYQPVRADRPFKLGKRGFKTTQYINNKVLPIRHGFAHESFRHPDLAMLREKYRLADVVKPYRTELEKQMAMRDWICSQWLSGMPSVHGPYSTRAPDMHVDTLLTRGRRGQAFFCVCKAMASVQLASVFGWSARRVDIPQHTVYEIWSNELNKWYLCDSLYNTHYEKAGVPLSASEIRLEEYRNGAKRVFSVWGVNRHVLGPAHCHKYKWFAIPMHNNFFDFPPEDSIYPRLKPRDKYNNSVSKGEIHEEADRAHIDYKINQTEIFVVCEKDYLLVRFQHNMPNFHKLEFRIGGGRWKRCDDWRKTNIEWRPWKDGTSIEARCVNTLGVCGPTSSIILNSRHR